MFPSFNDLLFYFNQAIRCPKPQLPGFVTITPDKLEYAYGDTVSFGCHAGYTLNGDKVKTCLQSAVFGQNLPSCAGIWQYKIKYTFV